MKSPSSGSHPGMARVALAWTMLGLLAGVAALDAQGAPTSEWLTAWGTAVTWRPPTTPAPTGVPPIVPQTVPVPPPATATPAPPPLELGDRTLRQIVRVTAGGDRFRVVFSNTFGTAPLTIGGASVSIRDKDSAIVAASSRPLRFSGEAATMVPSGAAMTSDPVDLAVTPFTDLAIDLYLPADTPPPGSPVTLHGSSFQTNYVSSRGNHAGETSFQPAATSQSWFLLSRVEVLAAPGHAAIVAIGDSITDGTRSTADTNSRWPDEFARRLQANAATRHLSVVNAGIAGNRLLTEYTPNFGINLLARFDRDVLAHPGVKYVILLEGINDIGMRGQTEGPSAAALIGAHRQVIERAHAAGLKIIGATLTPFEGAAYFTPAGEVKRQAVNTWIRTGKEYDGVIDFDAAVRDPAAPTKILSAYNSGDSLHPSDAGYKAMAAVIDLAMFK